MAGETILQHPIAQKFIYPFLLIFFIVFAILEKTQALGEGRKQLNALVSFIIGLIFVSAVSPKMVVQDMILFLTVAIVVSFVILLLWGFISGRSLKGGEEILKAKGLKGLVVAVIVIAVAIALISAVGVSGSGVVNFLFHSSWSSAFWTNFLFVVAIAAALAVVLSQKGGGGK